MGSALWQNSKLTIVSDVISLLILIFLDQMENVGIKIKMKLLFVSRLVLSGWLVGWLVVLSLTALLDSISVYIGPSPIEREKEGKKDK